MMRPEDQVCALCLSHINNQEYPTNNSCQVNSLALWSEFQFILGEWYHYVPNSQFCSECIQRMISILKSKADILNLIFNNYSAIGLKQYVSSLQTLLSASYSEFDDDNFLESCKRYNGIKSTESVRETNNSICDDDNEMMANIGNDAILTEVNESLEQMNSEISPGDHQCESSESLKKSEIKIFQCGICPFHTISRSELQKHNSQEHKIGSKYICKICGSTFKRKYSCIFHQSVHSDIRPFTCKYCGRGFNWQSLLRKHERLHTGEKPYKCTLCEQKFRLLEQLHKHKKSHSTGEPDKVVTDTRDVCEKCGKLYSSHEALYRHLKTHDRKHQCPLCDFSTDDDEEYSKHQNRHSKARRHHCLICHKAFIRREHLTRHLRIHTGETPYRCSRCGKGFAQSQDVKKHERTHTGERPYCCHGCGRSFSSKISLKRHKCTVTDTSENCELNDLNIHQGTRNEAEILTLSRESNLNCAPLCLSNDITETLSLSVANKCDNDIFSQKSIETVMQPINQIINRYSDISNSVPSGVVEQSPCLTILPSSSSMMNISVTNNAQSFSDSISSIDHAFGSANNALHLVGTESLLPNLCPSMLPSSGSHLTIMTPAACITDETEKIIPEISQQNILVLGLQNMKTCSDENDFIMPTKT